jgi:4-hydroxy-3-polyprenylbenzoate decarboxylase
MPAPEVSDYMQSGAGFSGPAREIGTKLTRRTLLGSAAGLAAATTSTTVAGKAAQIAAAPTAPFKSMRDYIAALDARGLVVRIPEVDQDAYEATALMYRMRDQHGMRGAPVMIFERIRIDGEWIEGPLIVNESGNLQGECLIYGLEPVNEAPLSQPSYRSYKKARSYVEQLIEANDGMYPTIDPVRVASHNAACKEVILKGDEIDLTRFAFIKGNPGDAGRYINTTMVFTQHPKYGPNYGTYRCHLRGPRDIAINCEPGQTGYRNVMAIKKTGARVAKISIALTADPYAWMLSGSKVSMSFGKPVDELAIAGGLAGRPTETVKSETNDIYVPAWAEMIIEGEIPLDDFTDEGPYAEWYGYQGPRKADRFKLRVTAVTHRRKPWLMNNFTGVQAGTLMSAGHAGRMRNLRQRYPHIVDWIYDTRASGLTIVSINKTKPGQGIEIANDIVKKDFTSKIAIVVDADVNIYSHEEVLMALKARWQPVGNMQAY